MKSIIIILVMLLSNISLATESIETKDNIYRAKNGGKHPDVWGYDLSEYPLMKYRGDNRYKSIDFDR